MIQNDCNLYTNLRFIIEQTGKQPYTFGIEIAACEHLKKYNIVAFRTCDLNMMEPHIQGRYPEVLKEFKTIRKDITNKQCGLPDLLCYNPKEKNFFFCEVKSQSDSIRMAQINWAIQNQKYKTVFMWIIYNEDLDADRAPQEIIDNWTRMVKLSKIPKKNEKLKAEFSLRVALQNQYSCSGKVDYDTFELLKKVNK